MVRHVIHMGQKRDEIKISIVKTDGLRYVGRPTHRLGDIRTGLL
jgi:hypothetical protein